MKKSALSLAVALIAGAAAPALAVGLSNDLPAIEDIGNLHGGQQEQIAAEKNLLNQQLQSLTDAWKQIESAKQAAIYRSQTHEVSQLGGKTCSQSCEESALLAQGVISNFSKLPAIAGGAQTPPVQTVGEQKVALVKALQKDNPTAASLFDPTATDEAVALTIQTLTAPIIPNALPAAQKRQPAGISYDAATNETRARLSLATSALQFVASDYRRIPTIDQSTVDNLAQKFSISNPPTAPLSPHELMDMIVQGVYVGNADWLKWLQETNEAGAWRALTVLKAMNAAEDARNHQLKEYLVALESTQQAEDADRLLHKANGVRDNTVDAVTRGTQ